MEGGQQDGGYVGVLYRFVMKGCPFCEKTQKQWDELVQKWAATGGLQVGKWTLNPVQVTKGEERELEEALMISIYPQHVMVFGTSVDEAPLSYVQQLGELEETAREIAASGSVPA